MVWLSAPDLQQRRFRVHSFLVLAGALIGAATAKPFMDYADPAAPDLVYLMVLAGGGVGWLLATYLHSKKMN